MLKESITERQGLTMLILFIIGSTLVVGVSDIAKQDSWLSVILALIMALPVLLIYARLLSLYPGEDIFAILHHVFGPVVGKFFSLLYVWYAIHLGALVMRNFSEFLTEISLTKTPQYFIHFVFALLCIWAVKGGIEVLGRWASFVFNILIALLVLLQLMTLPQVSLANFEPILYHGLLPVIDGAFSIFSFPLMETVVFMSVLSLLKPGSSGYKVYNWGLFIGGIIILLIVFRNNAVLGHPFLETQYFPSYISLSLINLGEFLQRFEVIISIAFLLCGFLKVSVCIFCAATGISKIFIIDDYRIITAPVAFLMLNLAILIYASMQEMFEWVNIYRYYAIPFQLVLPLITWIGAEIKTNLPKSA